MHMRSAVAGKIAAVLETRIQLSEALQAARLPTEDLDAFLGFSPDRDGEMLKMRAHAVSGLELDALIRL
jgi:hypothetical protein